MIRHGPMRQALWLVKNGVPFDTAMNLDPVAMFAWSVIFREFEGAEFDDRSFRFKEQKS
ncbi:MAG: hypothetical protein NVS9B10_15070 [Nevskia sp.]